MSQSGCEKCQGGVYSGEYSLFEGGSAQPARVADPSQHKPNCITAPYAARDGSSINAKRM